VVFWKTVRSAEVFAAEGTLERHVGFCAALLAFQLFCYLFFGFGSFIGFVA
jgi:hypothetical protein